jgi:3-dehydroquinate dehydratase-1
MKIRMNWSKKIIISIPFSSEEQFKSDVQNLIDLRMGIDHVEVRFDYWKEKLEDNQINEVAHYLRSNQMKMIFTYKLQKEQDNEYITILHRLISYKPDYIDLDTNIIASRLTELADYAIQNGVAIVYSYHNLEETPSIHFISDLCEFFIQMLPKFTSNADNILKMVFLANHPQDESTVINFCKQYANQGFNLVCFCLGEAGKKSRIQSLENGSAFTYVYIGKPTAPGQIHISEMKQYLLD